MSFFASFQDLWNFSAVMAALGLLAILGSSRLFAVVLPDLKTFTVVENAVRVFGFFKRSDLKTKCRPEPAKLAFRTACRAPYKAATNTWQRGLL